jgi:hypothetical protein
MNITIDKYDIEYLHNAKMKSFVNIQPDRFEFIKPLKKPINCHENGTLYWCGQNYINALILFNWFKNKNIESQILWDLVENPEAQFVVWSNTKFK